MSIRGRLDVAQKLLEEKRIARGALDTAFGKLQARLEIGAGQRLRLPGTKRAEVNRHHGGALGCASP